MGCEATALRRPSTPHHSLVSDYTYCMLLLGREFFQGGTQFGGSGKGLL